MKNIVLLTLAIALLLLGCSKQNPVINNTVDEDSGMIKGRIVDKDTAGLEAVHVFVSGTNIISRTDKNGDYIIYDVPEGKYTLTASAEFEDTEIDTEFAVVQVTAGDTVVLHELTVSMSFQHSDYDILVNSLFLYDPQGNVVADGESYSGNFSTIGTHYPGGTDTQYIYLNMDTIQMKFQIKTYNTDYEIKYPLEQQVTVYQNGGIIYDRIAPKGRVETGDICLTGNDFIHIMVDGKSCEQFFIQESLQITGNYVFITTGKTALSALETSTYNYYSDRHYVLIDSTAYWISYAEYDSVDWDLYLINEATGDTCYWANPTPDWGKQNVQQDNPVFQGDEYIMSGAEEDRYFTPDIISAGDLPGGVYSVWLRFYNAPETITHALPQLNIALGSMETLPELANFCKLSPQQQMEAGGIWFAGKIYLSEKVFNTTGQTIFQDNKILSKARR
jgi:hypothetical protein